jgi:hypothetical protein
MENGDYSHLSFHEECGGFEWNVATSVAAVGEQKSSN